MPLESVSLFRITRTYTLYNQTIDEPFHIAAGLEWIDKGTFTIEQQHTRRYHG